MCTAKHSPGPQRIQDGTTDDLVISNRQVQCPVCEKDVKVGMGGLLNFWKQHNPGKSKVCQLALKKKNKLEATQRSQSCLQSFFTKCPKDLVPPTVPIVCCVIAHVVKPGSLDPVANGAALSPIPNSHVNTILTDLEKAISNLPSTHPNPTEIEELSIPWTFPTNIDRDDAWEFILNPHLNRFLGFGKSVEDIAASLKGQKKALVSLVIFLRDYTRWFKTDGAHLEGKV